MLFQIYYDSTNSYTMAFKEEEAVRVASTGADKRRMTAFIGINAKGEWVRV